MSTNASGKIPRIEESVSKLNHTDTAFAAYRRRHAGVLNRVAARTLPTVDRHPHESLPSLYRHISALSTEEFPLTTTNISPSNVHLGIESLADLTQRASHKSLIYVPAGAEGESLKQFILTITTTLVLIAGHQIDARGQSRWVKTFGGTGYNVGHAVATTPGGDVVIAGCTSARDRDFEREGPLEYTDIFVIKLGNDGHVKWKKYYGGDSEDMCRSIAIAPDGGMLLSGYTYSTNGDFEGLSKGGVDIFVIKLDTDGNILWKKLYGGVSDDIGLGMSTSGENILITGSTFSNDGDFEGFKERLNNAFVIKLDNDGNVLWTREFGGKREDIGYAVTATSQNDVVIVGTTESDDGDFDKMYKGVVDIFVIKLDAEGNTRWKKTLGGSLFDYAYSVASTPDGDVLITGATNSYVGDSAGVRYDFQILVVKFDVDGNVIWNRSLGGTESEFGNSITTGSDGSVLITGYSESNDGDFAGLNRRREDIFVVNLDQDGSVRWKDLFGGSNSERGYCIRASANNDLFIVGTYVSDDGDFSGMERGAPSVFVMKLDSSGVLNPPASVSDNSSATPFLSVSPNPLSATSTITYNLDTPSQVRIELLNMFGEIIAVVHDERVVSGTHRIALNIGYAPSGVYNLRMTSEASVHTTQVVVVR